jgi:zinc/manganese transport system permease protein
VIDCVDPGFFRTLAGRGGMGHAGFLGLVVLNLVAGFHAIGTLLAVGVMMLPAATARLWSNDLLTILLIAAGVGVAASFAGLMFSFHWSLPAGPAIILVAGFLYILSLLLGAAGGLVTGRTRRRHLEA